MNTFTNRARRQIISLPGTPVAFPFSICSFNHFLPVLFMKLLLQSNRRLPTFARLQFTTFPVSRYCTGDMSAPAQNGNAKAPAKPNGKTDLKILMLHGKMSGMIPSHCVLGSLRVHDPTLITSTSSHSLASLTSHIHRTFALCYRFCSRHFGMHRSGRQHD